MNGPDEIDCVSEMNKLNGRELDDGINLVDDMNCVNGGMSE